LNVHSYEIFGEPGLWPGCGGVIRIRSKENGRELIREWIQGDDITDFAVSATVEAIKP